MAWKFCSLFLFLCKLFKFGFEFIIAGLVADVVAVVGAGAIAVAVQSHVVIPSPNQLHAPNHVHVPSPSK